MIGFVVLGPLLFAAQSSPREWALAGRLGLRELGR